MISDAARDANDINKQFRKLNVIVIPGSRNFLFVEKVSNRKVFEAIVTVSTTMLYEHTLVWYLWTNLGSATTFFDVLLELQMHQFLAIILR